VRGTFIKDVVGRNRKFTDLELPRLCLLVLPLKVKWWKNGKTFGT
jgi:hypothetical protein